VGLIPRRALEVAAVNSLRLENFNPEMMIEDRLASVLAEERARGELRALAEGMVAAVAAPVPTPGGGSVASLAGALGAALGEMACGVTLKRKSFEAHFARLQQARTELARCRAQLLERIDRDSESYQQYLNALRLPKATGEEQARRDSAIEAAAQVAVRVPLDTAQIILAVERLLASLRTITIPPTASDLSVAALMARAGRSGSIETSRTNLALITDADWAARTRQELEAIENFS
jgi:formiminotetrahydrofolate cyclodeaminase